MKLRQVEIENFRGIVGPFTVSVDDFTAIIGRNEVGKSTVLAAIAIFLEADGIKMEEGDGCVDGDPANVRITCEFDELPGSIVLDDSFPTSLEKERVLAASGRLRITKEFDCTKKAIKPNIFIDCSSHPTNAEGSSLLVETLPNLKKIAKSLDVELETGEATVKAKVRHAIVSRSEAFTEGSCKIPIGKNESATLWDQVRKHLPLCALFNADRPSSDQDPEAQDPIKVAVDRALSGVNEQLEALAAEVDEKVQGVANDTLEELRQINAELADDLIATLREELKWKGLFKYALQSRKGVPMTKRGSGTRRLILLSFFRAEAKRKAVERGEHSVLYLVEEPETAQHPDHQRMVVNALKEISENGDQVMLTTHAPGLAGGLDMKCIRFMEKEGIESKLTTIDSGEESSLFRKIGDRLGMLPDNGVKVLVCVEGANDVRFLQAVSKTLHEDDAGLPDLCSDHRFMLVPMHGSNLRDIVQLELFRNYGRPECHIYDRDDSGTYRKELESVEGRGDGSLAIETKKRYMESYIHPAAIRRTFGVDLVNDGEVDVVAQLSQGNGGSKIVKRKLANEVAATMTVEEIGGIDSEGEIRSWLQTIVDMAGALNQKGDRLKNETD